MSTVAMQNLVDELVAEILGQNPDRALEFRIGTLPEGHGDPAMLRQVMVNLLANAVKFSRGRVPAVIEVGSHTSPEEIVYYVKDNGVGFSMEYANKLFGVFQRLHSAEEFEGTGVGLALVQRIVHRHGGKIWAEAELNKGATFYFTLSPTSESE
jgi:light-regulated signal transduction histidine kinase (bacteriophytochrome)